MKKLILIPIVSLCILTNIFAQQEKIYYNSNWDVTNSNDFDYYIEINKPEQKVMRYLINQKKLMN
jgi:hypothetical protein